MLSPILTATQQAAYEQDGVLIIRDFVTMAQCDELMARAHTLIDQFDVSGLKTAFSTLDQRHAKHQNFIESSSDIRFFFETGALDDNGELIVEKARSINKIGHALHDLDPVFQHFSQLPAIQSLSHDLGLQNPLLLQSMYICKQPHIGGEVTCHQDGTYLHTEQATVVGLWFALEDATRDNGCLWAIPGGHRTPLKSRFLRAANDELRTEVYDETPWDLEAMVPLEVPRGSVIVLHSQLPHMSYENTSSRSRHAYTLHLMSGHDNYPKTNWLQRPAHLPFTGFKR
jgi:phytanoyl-CoA hydroxylase